MKVLIVNQHNCVDYVETEIALFTTQEKAEDFKKKMEEKHKSKLGEFDFFAIKDYRKPPPLQVDPKIEDY